MLGEGATHLTAASGRDDGGPREHLAVGDLEQAPGSPIPTTPHPSPPLLHRGRGMAAWLVRWSSFACRTSPVGSCCPWVAATASSASA